jgi:hypothetical protein
MSKNTPVKDAVRKRLDELKTMRDEIRLELHLASMDLRDEWRALERRLPDPGAAADEVKEATSGALDAITEQLRNFRDRLRQAGSL